MPTYTKETALYDTGAISDDIDDASKTATNYISVDQTGIRIANSNPVTATTYQHQTATNTEFVVNNASVGSFGGDGVRIGKSSESHMELDYHSLIMRDANNSEYLHISDLTNSSGYATLATYTDPSIVYSSGNYYYVELNDCTRETYDESWNIFDAISSIYVEIIDGANIVLQKTLTTVQTTPNPDGTTEYMLRFDKNSELPDLTTLNDVKIVITSNDSQLQDSKAYTLGTREIDNVFGTAPFSVVIGKQNMASGLFAFSEGRSTKSKAEAAHSEGYSTVAKGKYSHSEGNSAIAASEGAHAEGVSTKAGITDDNYGSNSAIAAHAEGYGTYVYEIPGGHSEGVNTRVGRKYWNSASFPGTDTSVTPIADRKGAHAEGYGTESINQGSHSEGVNTMAHGIGSHSEGVGTLTQGTGSHAEGHGSISQIYFDNVRPGATGLYSHSEGDLTAASGESSHAEGRSTVATGKHAHAEGCSFELTVRPASMPGGGYWYGSSNGYASHSEGIDCTSVGDASHAEGESSVAIGNNSHAQNYATIAVGTDQTTIGRLNVFDYDDEYAFIIGNGDKTTFTRSNALTVDWDGIIKAGLKSGTIDINTSTIRSTNTNDIHSNGVCCSVTFNVRNDAAIANGSNIVIGTVPEEFRPPQAIYSACSASTTAGMSCYVTLGTAGAITCYNRSGSSVAANTALAATFTYAI